MPNKDSVFEASAYCFLFERIIRSANSICHMKIMEQKAN
jgi:hypothetical protein